VRRNLTCWSCKQPVLVKDIGEERTRWPGNEQEYLCKTCQRKKLDKSIRETRERMGIDGTAAAR
jgi:transposase-like protein